MDKKTIVKSNQFKKTLLWLTIIGSITIVSVLKYTFKYFGLCSTTSPFLILCMEQN